jgi:hypothetical protein
MSQQCWVLVAPFSSNVQHKRRTVQLKLAAHPLHVD